MLRPLLRATACPRADTLPPPPAAGPSRFLLAPPSPPVAPATPPPSPSPPSPANLDVIDASVDDATTSLSVLLDVEGSDLLPLTPETQGNIILAAASTWAGAEGMQNVTGIQFTTADPVGGGPAIVTAQLRVDVAAGLARDVAQFIVGTSDDGSLVQELQGQGGWGGGDGGTPAGGPRPAQALQLWVLCRLAGLHCAGGHGCMECSGPSLRTRR